MLTRIRRLAAALPAAYHKFCSPFLPRACRFYPSCAVYASEAIAEHGVARGTLLGLRRLSRCHPWSVGGYDPVK